MAIDNFTEFDRNRYSVFAPPQEQRFGPQPSQFVGPQPSQFVGPQPSRMEAPPIAPFAQPYQPSAPFMTQPSPPPIAPFAQPYQPLAPFAQPTAPSRESANMPNPMTPPIAPFAEPYKPLAPFAQQRPMTEQEQTLQKQVGERIARGDTVEQRYKDEQRMKQEMNIAVAKAGIGARAIIASLTKQGMSESDLRSQVDNALKDKGGIQGASKMDALAVLNKINMSRQSRPQDMAKIEERAINNSKYETDETGKQIPANAAAWAKDRMAELDSFVPEGFPDKGLKDYMDKGEYAQLQRTLRLASNNTRGSAVDTAMKLAESNIQKAKGRANRDYQKKVVSEARKAAQNADERKLVDDLKGELEGIQKRMKKYEDTRNEKDKAKIMSAEQYAGYQSRSDEILGQMQNMNRPQGEQQELERVTADGRIAIFDANTKQFIRYK